MWDFLRRSDDPPLAWISNRHCSGAGRSYSVRTLYIPNQRRHIETENHNPESRRLGDLSCPRRGVGLRWAVRSRSCRPQFMSVVAPDEMVHRPGLLTTTRRLRKGSDEGRTKRSSVNVADSAISLCRCICWYPTFVERQPQPRVAQFPL